jgi:hypothetical protein
MATVDTYILKAEELVQQLRQENRKLVECEDEMDKVWARIAIDKLTTELSIINHEIRKKMGGFYD